MSEPCACARWEGAGNPHVAVFPSDVFETIEREDLGDYHGAVPHRGRLRCHACGATFAYESDLTSTVVTREPWVDRVVAALRAGRRAQVGGGRIFDVYEIRDGQPFKVTSDEGHLDERRISEAELRAFIEDERNLFEDYLRLWKA